MKHGDTVISAKDNSSEILVLKGDGNLYGNRTSYNYGKMSEEENKTAPEEQGEESSGEENKSEDKENA